MAGNPGGRKAFEIAIVDDHGVLDIVRQWTQTGSEHESGIPLRLKYPAKQDIQKGSINACAGNAS